MEMTHVGILAGQAGDSRVRAGASGLPALSIRLGELATGTVARVVSVADDEEENSPELGRRLAELGFLPGEKVRIVARGFLGREPIAVRIGTGTFALRSFEAACIRVSPELSPGR